MMDKLFLRKKSGFRAMSPAIQERSDIFRRSLNQQFPRRPYLDFCRDEMIWKKLSNDVMKEEQTHFQEEDEDLSINPRFSDSDTDEESDVRHKHFFHQLLPNGVLMVHILELIDLYVEDKISHSNQPFFLYVEIRLKDCCKFSPVYTFTRRKSMIIDYYCYFTTEVVNDRQAESNQIAITIKGFQNPKVHCKLAKRYIPLFDALKAIHLVAWYEIRDELLFLRGRLAAELCFTYGTFGYGASDQLESIDTPIAKRVGISMFPRFNLSPDDIAGENSYGVRMPRVLRVVTMQNLVVTDAKASLLKNLKLSLDPEKAPGIKEATPLKPNKVAASISFNNVQYVKKLPNFCQLGYNINQKFFKPDFNYILGCYVTKMNRVDRLIWLHKLNRGKLKHFLEYEVKYLFESLSSSDSRQILNIKKPQGSPEDFFKYFLKPRLLKKTECYNINRGGKLSINVRRPIFETMLPKNKTFVRQTTDDLKFFENFHPAPRFSGYLAIMFGYCPKSEKFEEPLNSIDTASIPRRLSVVQETMIYFIKVLIWPFWILYLFLSIIIVFIYFIFIFPFSMCCCSKFTAEQKIPEISISCPNVDTDETEKYGRFVNEQKYYGSEVDATKLIKKKLQILAHLNKIRQKQRLVFELQEANSKIHRFDNSQNEVSKIK